MAQSLSPAVLDAAEIHGACQVLEALERFGRGVEGGGDEGREVLEVLEGRGVLEGDEGREGDKAAKCSNAMKAAECSKAMKAVKAAKCSKGAT